MVLVVALQDVRLYVEVERFLDGLLVLDIERYRVEVFIALAHIRIAGLKRSRLIAQLATNRLLQEIVGLLLLAAILVISLLFQLLLLDLARLFGGLSFLWLLWFWNKLLNLIAKDVVELVSVLLDAYVDRLPVELERLDEAFRDEVRFFRLLQVCEDALKLVEDVVVELFLSISGALCEQLNVKDCFPQVWDHVELLEQGVHVACAAKVLQADVAGCLLDADVRVELFEVDVLP